MTLFATLLVGFSVVVAVVLFVVYAFFLHNLNKSPRALLTGAGLLLGLSFLQLGHLHFFVQGVEPLDSLLYRGWLFLVPSMFYLFSRAILFDERDFHWQSMVHLTPVLLVFVPRIEVALGLLFCIGTGYSIWLTQVVYSLRGDRERSKFELFFLMLFTLMAVGVLVLGLALPYMQAAFFYYAYTLAIGVALVLVVATLLGFPELLGELAEVAKARYSSSTLNDVDIEEKKRALEQLLVTEMVYQQEELSLASLAQALDLGTHQLSELINREFQVSFSRLIRQHRVAHAKRLLREQPEASILSISMEVGFKSQSNFYAAFKEITGESPGSYRQQ